MGAGIEEKIDLQKGQELILDLHSPHNSFLQQEVRKRSLGVSRQMGQMGQLSDTEVISLLCLFSFCLSFSERNRISTNKVLSLQLPKGRKGCESFLRDEEGNKRWKRCGEIRDVKERKKDVRRGESEIRDVYMRDVRDLRNEKGGKRNKRRWKGVDIRDGRDGRGWLGLVS